MASKRKILVTGGTGFLGLHLVPKLLAEGHSVRVIARSKPSGLGQKDHPLAGVELFEGDLGDPSAVRRALSGIEVVYHLAGRVSFDPKDGPMMYALHVRHTRALLEAVAEAKVERLILASTSGTIGVSKTERVATEADDYPITVVGRWPYYLSKIYEEKLALEFCRSHQLPLVVLNPSLLLGPGDARGSSTWTVMKFLQREIPALPGGGMSFVDARDAADAFAAALTRGEIYGRHLMGVNMPMDEFFGRLERLTDIGAPRIRLGSKLNVLGAELLERWASWRGTEPALLPAEVDIGEHFFWVDSAKAERELGFRARDPQETLGDTVRDLLGRFPKGFGPKDSKHAVG